MLATIENEEEYSEAIEIAGRLLKKRDNDLTPDENAMLDVLVPLIEDFEGKIYPIRSE